MYIVVVILCKIMFVCNLMRAKITISPENLIPDFVSKLGIECFYKNMH